MLEHAQGQFDPKILGQGVEKFDVLFIVFLDSVLDCLGDSLE